jgi:hypothetical protein
MGNQTVEIAERAARMDTAADARILEPWASIPNHSRDAIKITNVRL